MCKMASCEFEVSQYDQSHSAKNPNHSPEPQGRKYKKC